MKNTITMRKTITTKNTKNTKLEEGGRVVGCVEPIGNRDVYATA